VKEVENTGITRESNLRVEVIAVELLGKECRDLLAQQTTEPATASTKGAKKNVVRIGEDRCGEIVLSGANVLRADNAFELSRILKLAAERRSSICVFQSCQWGAIKRQLVTLEQVGCGHSPER
jgi:hypothetical protein